MKETNVITVEALFQPANAVYQLVDRMGRVAHVRQDLIDDNKLEMLEGQLSLTASQYEAWFKIEELRRMDEALFRPNIYRFFEHRKFLLAHPELCHKYSNKFGAYSYMSFAPCLGALALSFTMAERVHACPECGESAHLFYAVGSVLSGMSTQFFICENANCQKEHTIKSGGMSGLVAYFRKVEEMYLVMYPNVRNYSSKQFSVILESFPLS
jgi:hypothetical protein